MKKTILCLTLLAGMQLRAQDAAQLLPEPVSITKGVGNFKLKANTVLLAKTAEEKNTAALFNEYIKGLGLKALPIKTSGSTAGSIMFKVGKAGAAKEGYQLSVNEKSILLNGNDAAGLFYGMQTLIQLLPMKQATAAQYPLAVEAVAISDYPRFQYRGMHLDVGRHFAPVSFIKKYIDYLAYHKFNNFHWHLTEDQGWRIEIKKYPLLTQVGGCREQTLVGRYGSDTYDGKKYCGFYTQAEVKEVVRYAASRHINVIPEIELPGHALAALSAYPQLGCTGGPYKASVTWGVFDDVFCAGNDGTFQFLQDVFDEVLPLFPSKFIHIGGDECPKTRWKHCAKCQARMKKENLKDEHELQSYFIQRIEKYLNSKGRNIIGWDEILEGGLAPNATVMSWRGEEGGIEAAKQHHNVIMTPGGWMYFDHSQSSNEDSVTIGGFTTLEKVYGYEPIPAALSGDLAKYVLGAQANVWTEYMNNTKKVEYMIFPRMSALSEVLWSPKEKRNWEKFQQKLPSIFGRYKSWGANFSNAYYDLQSKVIPTPGNGIGWELKSKNHNGKIMVKQGNAEEVYQAPIAITQSGNWSAAFYGPDNQPQSNWIQQQFYINKATGKSVTLAEAPHKNYAASGGFTLVDAVQNTMGMNKSAQFVGYSGGNMDAVVDLGTVTNISKITLHCFEQKPSWIYRPQFVVFYASEDGHQYQLLDSVINNEPKKQLQYSSQKPTKARFVKIFAKNTPVIPEGNPGAGGKAWLMSSEIEVE